MSEPTREGVAASKQEWIDKHMDRAHELAVGVAFGRELIEQADRRVFTNDLDALEHLILHEELPPDEMQAAAWLLVQRVRGLREDLNRLQQALVRSRGMREYVEESRTHGR